MALFFFVAALASGCRRLLADSVNGKSIVPRNLQQQDLHFESGDWAPNEVLLLEAEGDVCASGTGGDVHDGEFSASWDTPQDGCYRIDAHSAGEQCGFKGPVSLTIDWCAGRTETLQYTPGADGWTALGVFPFHPGHLGGITQEEGAVDAFRVVRAPGCEKQTPVFGSLTIDTDATDMPEDLASKIADRVVNMGDALTAFFHEIPSGRRLQGETALNHVVVDFDFAKLGSPSPTDAAVNDAVKLICGMLDTVECGNSASFKLDESGEAKKVRSNDGAWPVLLGLAGLVALVLLAATAFLAQKLGERTMGAPEPKSVFVTPKEAAEAPQEPVEEKKPNVIEDDNASTATPASLADDKVSLTSGDNNKAEQVV